MQDESARPRTLVLPPAPFAAALTGGWWLDRTQWPLPLPDHPLAHWLGWGLTGAGLVLSIWTVATLWRHHTTVNPFRGVATLCTDGPFQFSRNPIYLGDWLILAGLSLVLATYWPLLFSPLIWLLLRYGVIRHEEAHLTLRFGDAYRRYQARTRRWI